MSRSKLNLLPQNPEEGTAGRFPSWLHRKLPRGKALLETYRVLGKSALPTVCEEAKCPNRFECYSNKTATFLALGKECTRSCGFCAIDFSKTPKPPEKDEPMRIAESVLSLGLKHVVITMVARDDLLLGGAGEMATIITTVRTLCPGVSIEVLTSDFNGDEMALDLIVEAKPEVFNHNVETVSSLSPRVRHRATYARSLQVLHYIKTQDPQIRIKSGLMVGLGETEEEVYKTLQDLHEIGCQIVTIGQYLQADQRKLLVKAFIHPDIFEKYADYGRSLGIEHMYCGPLVRSSYHAHEFVGS